jgi:hypothetical protein
MLKEDPLNVGGLVPLHALRIFNCLKAVGSPSLCSPCMVKLSISITLLQLVPLGSLFPSDVLHLQ